MTTGASRFACNDATRTARVSRATTERVPPPPLSYGPSLCSVTCAVCAMRVPDQGRPASSRCRS
eukprot:7388586-Prymnesium_polylepis.1